MNEVMEMNNRAEEMVRIFNNPEFGEVRTIMIDDEPWFVGRDVAEALGYAKARNAIATHIAEDDKKDAPIQGDLGGKQKTTIINESGLYSLIFGSKLESAKKFGKWMMSEVLPNLKATDQNKQNVPIESTAIESNNLQIFNSKEFGDVRTIMIDGEPWFVGNDVALALGYKDPNSSIRKNVDDEDKLTSPQSWGTYIRQMTIINESGLYSLIFGSKLESAKKFKRWVTSEVLPALRKTGGYTMPMTTQDQIKLLAKGNLELNERVDNLSERMDKMENELPVLPIDADRITDIVHKKGVAIMGGKESAAYKNRSLRQRVYIRLYSALKYAFGVKSYKAIKRNQCEEALEYIRAWRPSEEMETEINIFNAQG